MAFPRGTAIVVDDEPDTVEMIGEMVSLTGFDVIVSSDSRQAIGLISKEKPDIVVLDVMMPGLSGLDVLRFMHRDPRLKDIPVIVVSARTHPEDIRECLEAGASVYLTKPVVYHDLKTAVQEAIAS